MESCLYEGVVRHERYEPVNHRFNYRIGMTFLDLEEVPALVRAGLLTERRMAFAGFRRGDHFGDPRQPLSESVRELVQEQTGMTVKGPIRLLTQLSCLGYYFSPLNLFYCYSADSPRLDAVVAEVQNTPWRERHCYVLWNGNRNRERPDLQFRHPKAFHVSPFMGMDLDYLWRLGQPGERLRVSLENIHDERVLFRADLNLQRIALTPQARFRMQCRLPLPPMRITAAIYRQAFHLWRKKCPFYPHPRRGTVASSHVKLSVTDDGVRSTVSSAID